MISNMMCSFSCRVERFFGSTLSFFPGACRRKPTGFARQIFRSRYRRESAGFARDSRVIVPDKSRVSLLSDSKIRLEPLLHPFPHVGQPCALRACDLRSQELLATVEQ